MNGTTKLVQNFPYISHLYPWLEARLPAAFWQLRALHGHLLDSFLASSQDAQVVWASHWPREV